MPIPKPEWLPLESCPLGKTVLLLGNTYSVALGKYSPDEIFWIGWYPIPTIPYKTEHE